MPPAFSVGDALNIWGLTIAIILWFLIIWACFGFAALRL